MSEVSSAHLRLASMALAHAVWSVEDGETLTTMAMLEEREGRSLTRYEADTIQESVEEALFELKGHLTGTSFAALVYDGFYTDDEGDRRDALIVELLAANTPGESETTASQLGRIAQRYIPGERSFLRRKRVELYGQPLLFGSVAGNAVELVIEGALEHEKVRDLFLALGAPD
jgi:hypothetical protein